MHVKIERVYDAADAVDGFRILVDRLWPRDLTKVHATVDLWLRHIAPSTELRRWFSHDLKMTLPCENGSFDHGFRLVRSVDPHSGMQL